MRILFHPFQPQCRILSSIILEEAAAELGGLILAISGAAHPHCRCYPRTEEHSRVRPRMQEFWLERCSDYLKLYLIIFGCLMVPHLCGICQGDIYDFGFCGRLERVLKEE